MKRWLVRICVFLLLGAIVVALSACSGQRVQTQGDIRASIGEPDLIEERAGAESRKYLPAHRPEYPWPSETTRVVWVYASSRQSVAFERGRVVKWTSLSDEEVEDARLTVARLTGSQ